MTASDSRHEALQGEASDGATVRAPAAPPADGPLPRSPRERTTFDVTINNPLIIVTATMPLRRSFSPSTGRKRSAIR